MCDTSIKDRRAARMPAILRSQGLRGTVRSMIGGDGFLHPESMVDMPRADRAKINLFWLIRLRWAAAFGQLLTISVTRYLFGIDIDFSALLAIIGLEVVSNLAIEVWYRYASRRNAELVEGATGERLIGAILVFDLFLLTGLLYFSGGPANPFSIFYIVSISLAAAVLRPRWAWSLTLLAAGCFSSLFLRHVSVAALSHHSGEAMVTAMSHEHGDHHHHHHVMATEPMALHLRGMLIAFAGAACFVAYFVTRMRTELDQRDLQLAEAERRKSKAERLDSLVTLAAGAAHELASPLATIAVIARELENELGESAVLTATREDVRAICVEVERCREIIASLSAQAGTSIGESWSRFSVKDLVAAIEVEEPWRGRLRVDLPVTVSLLQLRLPRQALVQSLRSIVRNAWEASSPTGAIQLAAIQENEWLRISIQDHGPGIRPDVLDRLGEPFLTSKPHGSGLGLGFFLARRVMDQLGGRLEVRSEMDRGTKVTFVFPLQDELV